MSRRLAKILVGYDATAGARDALRLASVLAGTTGAELVLVCVYRSDEAEARLRLDDAGGRLPYGARPELAAVQGRSISRTLHATAAAKRADLIVIGQHRPGTPGLAALNGIADRLVHGAQCPVAVAPCGMRDQRGAAIRVIGVAYDGSPEARRALATAEALALAADATIRLIGVHEPATPHVAGAGAVYGVASAAPESGAGGLQDALEHAAESLDPRTRALVIFETGEPAARIAQRAQTCDLLVTGSRGYGPLGRVVLGSVSATLLHEPVCPVLVVPRGIGVAATATSRSGTAVAASP
jgi:nucleotide-binding universal stress UspA family protein